VSHSRGRSRHSSGFGSRWDRFPSGGSGGCDVLEGFQGFTPGFDRAALYPRCTISRWGPFPSAQFLMGGEVRVIFRLREVGFRKDG